MLFADVADEYDAGRPDYPAAIYDALGDLRSLTVLDVGAGTGIATRQLLDRGATVVPVDTTPSLLAHARRRTPSLPALVADGSMLPVRDAAVDLVCFAQSWHWLDEEARCPEVHRVLRAGGRVAAWWSQARADAEPWFDAYWTVLEDRCPGTHRDQRDTDWGATLDPSLFEVRPLVAAPWERALSVDTWMTDQASHSYVATMSSADRERLLTDLRAVLDTHFADGVMRVRYETWLWIGTRRVNAV